MKQDTIQNTQSTGHWRASIFCQHHILSYSMSTEGNIILVFEPH